MPIQINNSVTNYPLANNTNTQSTSASSTGASTGDELTANTESDIKVSSRAQKVQMLNEEFFSGGPASVTITPEFIKRLQEYGFISEGEAEKLNVEKPKNQKIEGTLGELSAEIKDLRERLINDSPDDSLIGILERADAIINNLDGSKPSSLASNIKTVGAELNAYLGGSEAKKLSDEEKESMNELSLALKIADKLNPNNMSSQKLNSYLSFM